MQHRTKQPSAAALSLPRIIGKPDAELPIPALIPIGKSTWWQWVRDSKAPPSAELESRTTAWKSADISALIDSLNATKAGSR